MALIPAILLQSIDTDTTQWTCGEYLLRCGINTSDLITINSHKYPMHYIINPLPVSSVQLPRQTLPRKTFLRNHATPPPPSGTRKSPGSLPRQACSLFWWDICIFSVKAPSFDVQSVRAYYDLGNGFTFLKVGSMEILFIDVLNVLYVRIFPPVDLQSRGLWIYM